MGDTVLTCKKCGMTKPAARFLVDTREPSGHIRVCKDCENTRRRAHRARLDVAERKRQNQARYARTERGKRSAVQSSVNYRERHPEKVEAQQIIGRALRSGQVTREPCLFCDAERVHAHHHDYSLPLAVTWLCHRHHLLAHGKVIAHAA